MAPILNLPTVTAQNVSSPLTYLPPHLAHQISTATYIHIGMTAVLIWDILDNLRSDYKLLWNFKFGIPSFLHFASRLSLLVYAVGRAALLTAPVGNCATLARAVNMFAVAFVVFATLLFYIRALAVHSKDQFMATFFGITWLAAIGMSSTFYIIMGAKNLGPTDYCVETIQDPHHLLLAICAVLFVNEALLYLAIVWKIYLMFLERARASPGQKVKVLICGASLPILSKVVLLDSQMYFLLIVVTKGLLVSAVIALEPGFHAMFIICHLVLVNVLAGRVYRNLKLGLNDEKELQSLVTNTGLPGQNALQRTLTFRASNHGSDAAPLEDIAHRLESGIQEKVIPCI